MTRLWNKCKHAQKGIDERRRSVKTCFCFYEIGNRARCKATLDDRRKNSANYSRRDEFHDGGFGSMLAVELYGAEYSKSRMEEADETKDENRE